MKKVFVSGAATYNRLIYIHDFPERKPTTIFSKGYKDTIGGCGAGKAFNLNRIGFDILFHTQLKDDYNGNQIMDRLRKENIDYIYEYDPEGTEMHTNLMTDCGGRVSIYTNYGTFEMPINEGMIKNAIKESDFAVLSLKNYVRQIFPFVKKYNKDIWIDIHDYDGKNEYHHEFIENANFLMLNSENMPDYKEFAENQIKLGKKLVVCTHGKNGAEVVNQKLEWFSQGIVEKYSVVDTNGAGDSFLSGFIYAYYKDKTLEECLKFGSISSGLCIESEELYSEFLSEENLLEEYKNLF